MIMDIDEKELDEIEIYKYSKEDFKQAYENLNLIKRGYIEDQLLLKGSKWKESTVAHSILRYTKTDKESSPRFRAYFVMMLDGSWGEAILKPHIGEPTPGQVLVYNLTAHVHGDILIPRINFRKEISLILPSYYTQKKYPTFPKICYTTGQAGFTNRIVHEFWKIEMKNGGEFKKVNHYIKIAENIWNSKNTNI